MDKPEVKDEIVGRSKMEKTDEAGKGEDKGKWLGCCYESEWADFVGINYR